MSRPSMEAKVRAARRKAQREREQAKTEATKNGKPRRPAGVKGGTTRRVEIR